MLPEEIKVTITDDHIKNGVREDCSYCAFALAIRSAVPVSPEVTDTCDRVKVYDSNEIDIGDKRYVVEQYDRTDADDFIAKFDSNKIESYSGTRDFILVRYGIESSF
jgi:biotin synthase-like enzyme